MRGALTAGKIGGEDRNTLTSKQFVGGSLSIVASKAPRNLRRRTARVILCDECDAMTVSDEGSPIALAEKRTLSFPNRKIVLGGTPIDADTSHVIKAYQNSDQRRFGREKSRVPAAAS